MIRYLEKFEDESGVQTYTFPLEAYEYQPAQNLRTAFLEGVGQDYAYDAQRGAPAPVSVASETVRFIVLGASDADVDTAVDALRAMTQNIGRGKLYTIDGSAVRRWCYARPLAMPTMTVTDPWLSFTPSEIRFQRFSPWFAESLTTVGATTLISTSPYAISVDNVGNIPVKLIAIRFRADGTGGFTNPILLNATNGYVFSSTRDSASANSELKVDTSDMSVRYSNDNGATYADDFALFTQGALQGDFFRLEPGVNALVYTDGGTPNLHIEIAFYPPFA